MDVRADGPAFAESFADTRGGHNWEESHHFNLGNEKQGFRVEYTSYWCETYLDDHLLSDRLQALSYGFAGSDFVCVFYDPVFSFETLKHCVRFAAVLCDAAKETLLADAFCAFVAKQQKVRPKFREVAVFADFEFLRWRLATLRRCPVKIDSAADCRENLIWLDENAANEPDAKGKKKYLDYYHELFVLLTEAVLLSLLGERGQAIDRLTTAESLYQTPRQPWSLIFQVKAFVLTRQAKQSLT